MSQIEVSESFDTVIESDDYQKSKLFLDVLNAEISERGDIEEEALEEKAKPDFLDMDKDGDKKEPMKKAAKDKKSKGIDAMKKAGNTKADAEAGERKKKTDEAYKKVASKDLKGNLMPYRPSNGKCEPGYVLQKSIKGGMLCVPKDQAQQEPVGKPGYKRESIVREGAEDNAEIIMAAKDMVDRVTNWMEDTAEMQTESMLELADAIRDEMGVDQSTQFVQGVKPALEGLYTAMEQARESLSNGVGLLTGEGAPAPAMGAEEMPADDMGMEPTVDMDAAEPMPAEGDVDLAAAGGEEPAGRETRESVDPRKLAQKLSKKK